MRGVEAPFQLLIAVFTMAMVMTLAYFVYQRVQTQHCEDMWAKDVGAFALKLQSVASGGAGTKDYVRIHLRCGDAGKHVFELNMLTENDKAGKLMCRRICGHDPPCVYIRHVIYSAKKQGEVLYSYPTCVEISPYTYFRIGQKSDCLDDYKYVGNALEGGGWSPSGAYVDILIYRPSNDDISVCAKAWGRS